MAKIIIKAYTHGSKENMYGVGEDAGLTDEALRRFSYALYEVEFDLEVDTETGEAKILKVDGREVA